MQPTQSTPTTFLPQILARLCAAALVGATALPLMAEGFSSGSDESYGAMNITQNTTLDLPANGVFNCTTITVAPSVTLSFNRNPLNTPVYLLATGDVLIQGTISVDGGAGGHFSGGPGGPGGFDGGPGGFSLGGELLKGGAGLGPGGGKSGPGPQLAIDGTAGGGAYATRATGGVDDFDGVTYGSKLLLPFVGGSGGGGIDGNPDLGGGGGGGAILIASNSKITVSGNINANGGNGGGGSLVYYYGYNGGSGGAIRLVAPRVFGQGALSVIGGFYSARGFNAGAGRIRIDSIFRYEPTNPSAENIGFSFNPANSPTVGGNMIVFPPNLPRLDILEAAGTAIPEGTAAPVQITLPFGSDPNRKVVVQAKNFKAKVPIRVVLTPQSGDPVSVDAEIDNTSGAASTATVNVTLPINTLVNVQVWTR